MKLFEEPIDIDLYVDSRPLTKEEESELSVHIKLQKQKYTLRNLKSRKTPDVIIDNSLAKYKELPIFQEKLNQANEILMNTPPPEFKNQTKK
ncbi:MAG: hypothetical protein WCK02_14285 [Bacteroidota bacterium]